MYSPIEKYLLCTPVPGLSLPALIEATEVDLWQREADLGLDRNSPEFLGELLFTLRLNGVVVLMPQFPEAFDGTRNPQF